MPRVRLANAFAAAVGSAVSDPALWVLGAAGFLLRGGWLVLAVPVWTLPSPVGISTLVGPEALGTGGLTPGLARLVLVGLVGGGLLVAIGLVGSAWVEVTMFERLLRDPEVFGRPEGSQLPQIPARRRRILIGALAALSAGALIPAALAGVLAAVALVEATYQEFYLPGSLAVPLAFRVAARAAPQVVLFCGAVVVAELLISVLSRRLIADTFGIAWSTARRSVPAIVARMLGVALLVWLVSVVLVVPGLAATLLGWGLVRDVFLAPDSLGGLRSAVTVGGATLVFITLWCAAVLLAGVASSLRAASWTAWWFSRFAAGGVTEEQIPASS